MNKIAKVLFAVALTATASGCESFLDINDNPNRPTSVTPDAVLANALTTTGALYTGGIDSRDNYNSYAAFAAGFLTKSGTVSAFSSEQTYNYSSNYYSGLFRDTYDNLNDYNIIQQGATKYPNHAAIARIMKVYDYLLLVDEYGDVPYTQALNPNNTTPAYDKAQDIYKDFIVQLKGAVTDINAAGDAQAVGSEDVVFTGNMMKWKQFANSLRLRILLRQSQTEAGGTASDYVKAEMAALQSESAADGFIEADVVVQPGYSGNTDQQNPFYTRYGYTPGLSNPVPEYNYLVPTTFVIEKYVDNSDPRITQLYRIGKVNNEAAYSGGVLGESQPPIFDAAGTRIGSRLLLPRVPTPNGGTFLRGPNAPTVLMLLAEQHFSKSEAETRGLFAGDAQTDYLEGIKASFLHTYRLAADPIRTLAEAEAVAAPGIAEYNKYLLDNVGNPNVDFSAAPADGILGKQTVIIFQKYLASNVIAGTEAWDDYRRTGKPAVPIAVGRTQRATRLLYPLAESTTNLPNIPKGITQFNKIFWDVVD